MVECEKRQSCGSMTMVPHPSFLGGIGRPNDKQVWHHRRIFVIFVRGIVPHVCVGVAVECDLAYVLAMGKDDIAIDINLCFPKIARLWIPWGALCLAFRGRWFGWGCHASQSVDKWKGIGYVYARLAKCFLHCENVLPSSLHK